MAPAAYEGWTILELMGHRRLAGLVSEVEIAGAKMLRIDIHAKPGAPVVTQFYGSSAIYALTPTTEEICRRISEHDQPTPVQRWELAAPEPEAEDAEYDDEEDNGQGGGGD